MKNTAAEVGPIRDPVPAGGGAPETAAFHWEMAGFSATFGTRKGELCPDRTRARGKLVGVPRFDVKSIVRFGLRRKKSNHLVVVPPEVSPRVAGGLNPHLVKRMIRGPLGAPKRFNHSNFKGEKSALQTKGPGETG
ncbi:hypothetical protein JTE90_025096 [Oedothorax gibbosus]|uniref:Uncharacterized protein n=1 Tax=Oedothorax gibbosus TaxID=931172 RepID=A0AAV6TD96_9ARAC|nr:hypothetical protein JTE90_025096 [Oedothorax gibbosus]